MGCKAAYYNELDRQKAAWLRELIGRGLIAPGEVDERSIADVRPDDLVGYRQCHFFAGIGVWSYALRRAGWPDEREVWTGSCPCQSFSVAGQRKGFADERHLWPAWFGLIRERRPGVVFGEQSASKGALAWLDLVQSDLEGAGYASGAVDICAAGFGAPHIRQRLYFVADRSEVRLQRRSEATRSQERNGSGPEVCSVPDFVADAASSGVGAGFCDLGSAGVGRLVTANGSANGSMGDASGARLPVRECGTVCGTVCGTGRRGEGGAVMQSGGSLSSLADADGRFASDGDLQRSGQHRLIAPDGGVGDSGSGPGPVNGHWRDADWIFCRDGRWRPVEPGASPLAHGAPRRVGRLRGYGDAIVAPVAQAFIEAYLERS